MKAIQIGDQVSFNYFRNCTRDRRVHYSVSYASVDVTTNGVLSNIFISRFIMGSDVKFYKVGKNSFKAIHKNYEAIFEVIGGI